MNTIHLVCNAHLDPAWLWEWDEGAAEAISTFRTAAKFCSEFDSFIFNHNEAVLYQWVEEYDPELFGQIHELVKLGKWHIMGGWYLQPDCNMPSGESFVRQILLGRKYFLDKFGVRPNTAINFDPFGHTRGLVQILKKSGYDSYIVCRPEEQYCLLPANDFSWVGFDGSEIAVHRAESYNSPRGQAHDKVQRWLEANVSRETGLVLWGIGNHGGGPSRVDLLNLHNMMMTSSERMILHSTPEAYFAEMKDKGSLMPSFEKDLNPWAVGCYTTQIRIKQKHRLLENELFMTEKMVSDACLQGMMEYPQVELHEVSCDLAKSEFHDILSGTSIQSVEENALRLIDHGLENVSRIKTKAFFALAKQQEPAQDDKIPVFVYNPHPFKVKSIIECEFGLPDIHWGNCSSRLVVCQDERTLPSQIEKEVSNLNVDWRKHIVFTAELEPSQMNRFECKIKNLPDQPAQETVKDDWNLFFQTEDLNVVINCKTGHMDKLASNGKEYLLKNAFKVLVIQDDDNSWGSNVQAFPELCGEFRLMTNEEAARFAGISAESLEPVRIIEDGEVRTIIESLFIYEDSFICQTYFLPKRGTEIQLQVRIYWNEKGKLLKLDVPTSLKDAEYIGQQSYGMAKMPAGGLEGVAQKWTGVVSKAEDLSLTCINDGVYGSSFNDGTLRLTLLRSPAYSSMRISGGKDIQEDRFLPRIDQGERTFNFWFTAGNGDTSLDDIDRRALTKNEKPYVLSFFTSGSGKTQLPLVTLEDEAIQMTTFKKAEQTGDYIIRLFEPSGKNRITRINLPRFNISQEISLKKFEIKTFRLNAICGELIETDLMEGI